MCIETLKIDENCELTINHPASHYRIPVLHFHATGKGFGPSEIVFPEKFKSVFGDKRAAHTVYSYAINTELDDKAREFIKLYLGQWPEGPQID